MPWDINTQNHLVARKGYVPRWLLYIYALETDRTDAPIGIWSGEYDATFTIDGTSRVYAAGSDGMKPDAIAYEAGTVVKTQNIELGGVNAQALEIVMGRIIRGRKAELHLMFMDPQSGTIIGYNRMFKGFVNRASTNTGQFGRQSSIRIELASSFRALTRTLGLKKSDQSQKARNGDRARRYSAVTVAVKTEWSRE